MVSKKKRMANNQGNNNGRVQEEQAAVITTLSVPQTRSRAESVSSQVSGKTACSETSEIASRVAPLAVIEEQLKKMLDIVGQMTDQARTQKNVGSKIKNNLPVLREAIQVALFECERGREMSKAPVRSEPRKRMRSEETPSPPEAQRKRRNETKDDTDTDWKTVARKKALKKKPKTKTDESGSSVTYATTVATNKTGKQTAKSARGRPTPKAKGGAVLIKPADGQTFADIVRTLRTTENPDNATTVTGVTKTKDGAVLIRTTKDCNMTDFNKRLQDVLGTKGAIRDIGPKVTLEVLDLDCLSDSDDVTKALDRELGTAADRKIAVLGPNSREQRVAICELNARDATTMLAKGRIKIGYVNCRIRVRLNVPRCYKCLGYGHRRTNCDGPDRRDCCWKCGKVGHKAKACAGAAACFLCPQQGGEPSVHVPGTAQCAAFKAALTKARTKRDTENYATK